MKYICALVVVSDVNRSRLLYEKFLRQKVVADYGENLLFEGGFALHQKSHFQQLIDGRPIHIGSNHFELYFEDDQLESIEKELLDNHFAFVHRIREQPWRQRVMRFFDDDQNIVEIGESMAHLAYRLYLEKTPLQEIAGLTFLTVDQITEAIKTYRQRETNLS
ncbi:glyoxalase/bleomycin resistance/dioxygenase family protein [candidate division KSB1 bacterium]|nr:glyoxalase/bleomycin resistance/dioxygenase family protein [candidate division KSB1 bacterium]